MFKEILKNNRYSFCNKFDTWEEAITASCQPILNEGIIKEEYIQSIISCIKKYGPYIVIAPDIALPHSTEGGSSVNGTAICFMKTKEPVSFKPGDPDMDVHLFFTLAANDSEKHMKNIQKIAIELSDDSVVSLLQKAENADDLQKVQSLIEEKGLNEIT